MRVPRLRFTIGRLMVMVLVAGLASWGVHVYRKLQTPIISELQALASYKQAILVREVAEYALKEYKDDLFLQAKANLRGQIAQAQADLRRYNERLEGSTNMPDEGRLTPRTRDLLLRKQRLELNQAEFDLEQAKTQLEILKNFTLEKQIKSLTRDVEEARADERAKLETYSLERSKRWRWGIMGF
jgi:hypothetical protein